MCKTWEEIDQKYTDRSEMTEEMERNFVNDCFSLCEHIGFKNKFSSVLGEYKDREGQEFKVISRCTENETNLSALPMWNIQFSDGEIIGAYAEEIVKEF